MRHDQNSIDLTAAQRKTILALLKRHLPNTEAWAYGSRVKFTSKPSSDLDMVVFSKSEQALQVAALREAFEESNLPFRVDIFVWDQVPDSVKANIEADRLALVKSEPLDGKPSTWREVSIREVADVIGGGTPSSKIAEYWGGDMPWLTPKDLSGYPFRRISRGARSITPLGLSKSSARILPKNSILITSRAPVGYVAIADNEISTNQGFKSLILKGEHDPDFFYYLIKHNVPKLKAASSGTTFKEISGSTLKQIRLRIPESKEQRAIAHILGSLDDKIELNRRMNKTLEDMAQAIFKSWFVDFEPVKAKIAALEAGGTAEQAELAAMSTISGKDEAALTKLQAEQPKAYAELAQTAALFPSAMVESSVGLIPEGWQVKRLKDKLSPKKGQSITRKAVKPGAVPVVAGGINPAYFHATANVSAPVITVSASGANAGFVNLYSVDVWASDCSYISYEQTDFVYSFFLFLKTKQTEITRMQHGAAQPHIYPKDLERLLVIDASEPVWHAMERHAKLFFDLHANHLVQTGVLQDLRNSLLPKLICGSIRPVAPETPTRTVS